MSNSWSTTLLSKRASGALTQFIPLQALISRKKFYKATLLLNLAARKLKNYTKSKVTRASKKVERVVVSEPARSTGSGGTSYRLALSSSASGIAE